MAFIRKKVMVFKWPVTVEEPADGGVFEESKFDEVIHLVSNPSRLMGINLIIGFFRGLGFALALIIIVIIILVSFSDVVFIG